MGHLVHSLQAINGKLDKNSYKNVPHICLFMYTEAFCLLNLIKLIRTGAQNVVTLHGLYGDSIRAAFSGIE